MKRIIAIVLTVILCFALVACGINFEEKGYTDAKAITDARSEELWPDGVVDDDTKLGFQFLITLSGFDNMVDSFMDDFAEQLPVEESWSEEQKDLYMTGARTAVSEWLQWVSGNSLDG